MTMPTIQPTFTYECTMQWPGPVILPFSSRRALFVATTYSASMDPVIGKVLAVETTLKIALLFPLAKMALSSRHIPHKYSMVCWHLLRYNGRITCWQKEMLFHRGERTRSYCMCTYYSILKDRMHHVCLLKNVCLF